MLVVSYTVKNVVHNICCVVLGGFFLVGFIFQFYFVVVKGYQLKLFGNFRKRMSHSCYSFLQVSAFPGDLLWICHIICHLFTGVIRKHRECSDQGKGKISTGLFSGGVYCCYAIFLNSLLIWRLHKSVFVRFFPM